ncbi:MAG: site-specific DNA-methyltransferase [Chloroflexi bacterium]|nr:site-specific DNA-methyltransferase [Chloroflexota bacterium]
MNKLYYGDCLTIMMEMPSASVDLIYLDPPFNSNRQYNAIYKDETGRQLPDQIEAFCDMWELDAERDRAIRAMPVLMRDAGIDDAIAEFWKLWMRALRDTQPRLLAYLSYMAQRLLVMHRLLKPTGSIYLHCDPTASHYIKALMDAVFGHANFRNEIIWRRTSAHNNAKGYGNVTDTILYYHRTEHAIWNPIYGQEYSEAQLSRYRADENGRLYRGDDLTAPGSSRMFEWRGTTPRTRGWGHSVEALEQLWGEGRILLKRDGTPRLDGHKRYLDEMPGPPVQNLWTDIPRIGNTSGERMGYATQKPLALLERIISASSNPGDVVLDPFCGCATTLEAAHSLDRRWIGIDIAIHAVKRVARIRLNERLGLVEGQDFEIEGVPRNVEGAKDLWQKDPYHFQKWAVEQVEGFVTTRRAADGGVDGRLYFAVPHAQDLQSMVIEVKGGKNVSIRDLRALKGVLDYDDGLMAGLIIMEPLGKIKARNFERFSADAGTLDILGIEYPRMQILTVEEIFEGKRFATPTVAGRHTLEPRMPGIPAVGV